jgi:ABC-2 type transport system ATP-binding protein
MFDEPVNGLDPEGILWIRTLMRSLAAEGRTVLVSSHLMSEMENTADHLIVVGRGKLIADCGMAEFVTRGTGRVSLEQAFMELTAGSVDYHAEVPAGTYPAYPGTEA